MAVDLHTHSRVSDGSDSPTELVANAVSARLNAFALTDHDTLDGLEEAQAAADLAGIRLIRGVELSLEWTKGGMHMVVLFLSPEGPLQDRLADLQVARQTRNDRMIVLLQSLGYDITMEELIEESGGGVVGRPHMAAILVRKGYFPDPPAVFDELLATGRPGYLGRDRLDPEEAIRLARASGGVPIIAHPHTLGLDTAAEYAEAMETLATAGLAGIECYYGDYPRAQQEELAKTTRRFGLIPSGGSDYHGTYKDGLELGTGRGELLVPDHVLEELEANR
jgi:predicted metal-dependent phosphoesterase TrpH